MSSTELQLSDEERRLLLELAREAIRHGVRHGAPPRIDLESLPPALRQPRATFVTLEDDGQLRGCIGSLEPRRPLAEDVVHNAFAAAFGDPRFLPVREDEVDRLKIHISVLSPLEEIKAGSEAELLEQIRPGVDGLVIAEGDLRGTFLPVVWQSLPDKKELLRHLRVKAGLPPDYWSDTMKIYRYTTQVIE